MEELYGDAGGRLTTDVDILVHSCDLDATLDALGGIGWAPDDDRAFSLLRDHSDWEPGVTAHHWLLVRWVNEVCSQIDVHTDAATARSQHPSFTPEIWARTSVATRDGVTFHLISPEDRLIFLCWHALDHGMQADRLADIARILSGNGSTGSTPAAGPASRVYRES